MALVKSSRGFGKKQSPASGSRSTATRKLMAGKKAKSGAKQAVKSHAKSGRSSAKFSSLKSRQMTVESLKRSIWASLHRITDALIVAASTGNLATAKELFHFAGVYSLPTPEENAATAPAPAATEEAATPRAEAGMVHPIDLFFKKIGVEPSTREPEAEVA
jgi:hypothetical protein